MHVTSLPGPYGHGDVGPEASAFLKYLASAAQRWWQTLPVVAPSVPGFSPYSAQSAFAGSPWLVSITMLEHEGLLPRAKPFGKSTGAYADLAGAARKRERLLRAAFVQFNQRFREHGEFSEFCIAERGWLDDWALFAALKTQLEQKPWNQWDKPLRMRIPAAMKEARKSLAEEIDFHRFVQFQFDRQWRTLRHEAARLGIGLIGDVPMFVAADSCDVWAHRELFTLDAEGSPTSVSGCPPDMFSTDGQFWRHPQYRWSAHRRTKFDWWVKRFQMELRRFDAVRIDHFLGCYRTWAIPADAKTAREGEWWMSPGRALLEAVHDAVGPAPIIAEDLGLLTPGAAKLREQFGFPGMRVAQFGFDDPFYLPHRYVEQCIAYTGTHDNNTTAGWFAGLKAKQRQQVLAYLNCSAADVADGLMHALLASVAHTAIVPIQDVLGLGSADRLNVPGSTERNWCWRLRKGQLTEKSARRMRELVAMFERLPGDRVQ